LQARYWKSVMKQTGSGLLVMGVAIWISSCSTPEKLDVGDQRVFRISHADSAGRMFSEIWTGPKLESLGMMEISSDYFDRAMHTSDSRFSSVAFSRLQEQFQLKRGEDAVLLNCFDDYQGVLSLNDINRYDLRLATNIKLGFGSHKPDWLNPLLIVVPNGKHPPFQERFLTANIRELKFIRLNDYYAPLQKIAGHSPEARKGLKVFKNNCLFCHSLKGRGGNKGSRLIETYGFLKDADRKKFLGDFKNFHHKDSTQDVEQFVTQEKLEWVMDYLKNFRKQIDG